MSKRIAVVLGTHSRSPVYSDKHVTANVRSRSWRLCDEYPRLPESQDDAINRLITALRSCTRASFRKSPLASSFTRKWISPISPCWGLFDAFGLYRLNMATFEAGITNAVSLFGLAFEFMTLIMGLISRRRGTSRGKRSLLPTLFEAGNTAVNAAWIGGMNSQRGTSPRHGAMFTVLFLLFLTSYLKEAGKTT